MSAPDVCTLTGKVYTPAGVLAANALVRYQILDNPPAFGDGQVSAGVEFAYTNGSGVWSVGVPQGACIRVRIDVSALDEYATVPAEATADFESLSRSRWIW